MALGISFVVFEPVVIQLYQQAMDASFNQALDHLGIDLTILVYARSAVAVLLGAILAVTNVESDLTEQPMISGPKRRIVLFERLLNQVAPVVSQETVIEQVDVSEQPTIQLPVLIEPPAQPLSTPQEREEKVRELDFTGLSNAERVARVLTLFPDVSDRELGKLSNLSPATAKKYRSAQSMQDAPHASIED